MEAAQAGGLTAPVAGRGRFRATAKPGRIDHVVATLGHAIARGDHPVGSVLPSEVELEQQLDASRGVIREAVKILAAKGLVTVGPGTGRGCSRSARGISSTATCWNGRRAGRWRRSCSSRWRRRAGSWSPPPRRSQRGAPRLASGLPSGRLTRRWWRRMRTRSPRPRRTRPSTSPSSMRRIIRCWAASAAGWRRSWTPSSPSRFPR